MADHFRRWERHPVRLRVTVRRPLDRGKAEALGILENLSLGGAFIRMEKPLEVSARVVVGIQSATTWDPLRLPGTIRWVRDVRQPGQPIGIGVEFDPLSREHAVALFRLFTARDYELD